MARKKKNQRDMRWWNVLDRLTRGEHFDRALLAGPPGTGKSSYPENRWGDEGPVYRVALTEDSGPEDLLGGYTLREGNTDWVDGPAVRAMREGQPLVLDEIDRGSVSVQSILHAILDDFEIARVHLPTGETVIPAQGYCVIATQNGRPQDLDEPILDRFDIVLVCVQPHEGILGRLPQGLGRAVSGFYANLDVAAHSSDLTARSALSFQRLKDALGPEVAAMVVWGDDGKEVLSVMASHS